MPRVMLVTMSATLLVACGGGSTTDSLPSENTSGSSTGTTSPAPVPAPAPAPVAAPAVEPTTTRDAARLADQASFGATEALIAQVRTDGPGAWVYAQMALNSSHYTSGGGSDVHQLTAAGGYCDGKPATCWRDNFSTQPLVWDFYRNAVTQPDQLRQRVAFALSQIVVVNSFEVSGTYGFRRYHNDLLDLSFANYRDVLKMVMLSPLMGDFLNNANNDKAAPNENFSREMLQLFTLGTCVLNTDGTLRTGQCVPTYDNTMVRSYAYALTGWTYPVGGRQAWSCLPAGTNCRYSAGDMVPVASRHDTTARTLLAGKSLAAGHTANVALEAVLDSVMAHPNMGPFIGRQLIQHLVTSNPTPDYVRRVAAAFDSGSYLAFGTGRKGDLAATVAAVLLDTEARDASPARRSGKLREPVQLMTGVLRALNGSTDGDALSYYWGEALHQHVFRAPSVFDFYPPDFPVAGTTWLGPTFAIHNANTALERLNYLQYLLEWGGSAADVTVPNAVGTKVNLTAFLDSAADAGVLVDRLSLIAFGQPLQGASRTSVVNAVAWWTASRDRVNWKLYRVRTAAYLVFASPQYQVQR
jgi:uncharacterized protein (DUF1800 family)